MGVWVWRNRFLHPYSHTPILPYRYDRGANAMTRWLLLIAALTAALAGVAGRAAAEHFDITLHVESPEGSATAGWDTSPPEGGANAPPAVTAHAGHELKV